MQMATPLCARRSTNSDLARQRQVVRAIAAAVQLERNRAHTMQIYPIVDAAEMLEAAPEQKEVALQEVSVSDAVPAQDGLFRAFFSPDAMAARQAWAKGLKDDSGRTVQAALKRANELGAKRRVASPPDVRGLNDMERDFPHCSEVLAFVRKRTALCSIVPDGPMRLPPILLHGPPGTGKTALSQRLAQWLRVPLVELDMATVETSFKVNGLDSGYASGKPGLIWDALDQECMSPVILLDEIDKCAASHRHDGLGWLLGLLEPSTAARYRDSCLGLPVDASCISWIATCNDIGALDAPLLSRFRAFEVPAPTHEHLRAVAVSVFREMRTTQPWAAAFEWGLPEEVLDALTQRSPREIRQALEDACANAALDGRRRLTMQDLPPRQTGVKRSVGFLP